MEGAEQVVVSIPEILQAEPPQAVPPVGTPASDPDFLTALHQACFTGELEEVERLLETNSSQPFQSPDEHGLTALHLAASGGHRQVAEELLTASRGREANLETTPTAHFVRAPDRLGRTALHHAARNGHASVVEVLLGAPEAAPSGASCPDLALVKDGVRQSTAFLLAAMMPGDHVDTVRLLLERDPLQIHAKVGDPQLGVADLKTLMRAELVHKADEASLRPKFSRRDYAVTKEEDDADRLRGRGVSIAGHTALHLAASQDNVQVMAHLLKQPDVDVNAIDDHFGMTPLHCAVRTGALRVMKTLLRLPMDKLDVNGQLVSQGAFPPRVEAAVTSEEEEIPYSLRVLDEGDTALHLAIKFGSCVQALETAELLCRLRHLTPSIRNKAVTRDSALDLALERWFESKIARWPRDGNLEVLEVMMAPQRLVDAIADHPDLQTEVNRVKQQEQGLQSTLNALLVGGTLMAGITFQGFLQPPFGTAFEYHPRAVKWFWVCNSLSFYFAIHTLLTTLHALLPAGSFDPPLAQSLGGTQLTRLQSQVLSSTVAMVVSTLSGVGAFATAGFANLPRGMYGVMLPTFVVGAIIITSSGLLVLRQGVWSLMTGLKGKGDRVPRYPFSKGVLIVTLICGPCLVPIIHMMPVLTNSDTNSRHVANRLATVVPMILIVIIVIIVAANS